MHSVLVILSNKGYAVFNNKVRLTSKARRNIVTTGL